MASLGCLDTHFFSLHWWEHRFVYISRLSSESRSASGRVLGAGSDGTALAFGLSVGVQSSHLSPVVFLRHRFSFFFSLRNDEPKEML